MLGLLDFCVNGYVVRKEQLFDLGGKGGEIVKHDIKKDWAKHSFLWYTCLDISEFGEVIPDPDAENPSCKKIIGPAK